MKPSALRSLVFSLFFIVTDLVNAQSPTTYLRIADQAYQLQNHTYALELYERVLFFHKDSVQDSHFLNIARCYVALKTFDKATEAFQNCAALAPNDSTRSAYFIKAAWCLLIQQSFQESLVILYNLPEKMPRNLLHEKNLYTGIALFKTGQFEEAQQALKSCTSSVQQQRWIDSLFAINQHMTRRFRPHRAKVLSAIIPGSGHLYAGDIKNGLNSLVLLGGLAILGANYSLQYTWIDSLVSIAPWFQRYYVGGMQRAERATAERLNREQAIILQQLIAGI